MPEDPKIVLTDVSPLDALPSYARVVAWIGLPAALCIFLVWIVTGDMKAQAKQQSADIASIKTILATSAINDATRIEQTWQLIWIQSRTCINTSRTQEDRIACASLSRPPAR